MGVPEIGIRFGRRVPSDGSNSPDSDESMSSEDQSRQDRFENVHHLAHDCTSFNSVADLIKTLIHDQGLDYGPNTDQASVTEKAQVSMSKPREYSSSDPVHLSCSSGWIAPPQYRTANQTPRISS